MLLLFFREEVQQHISNEATDIENDQLYTTLKYFKNSVENIRSNFLAMEPEVYLEQLIKLKDDVLDKRNIFIGHTLENSTGTNILFTNGLILKFAFSAQSLNSIINSYNKKCSLESWGSLKSSDYCEARAHEP